MSILKHAASIMLLYLSILFALDLLGLGLLMSGIAMLEPIGRFLGAEQLYLVWQEQNVFAFAQAFVISNLLPAGIITMFEALYRFYKKGKHLSAHRLT